MPIASETELYAPVKAFLEDLGYEVKGEVKSCDVMAMREAEEEPVLVELKKRFNLELLYQGIDRLALSSKVYLCVERTRKGPGGRKWSEAAKVCRRIGIGLMTVDYERRRNPYVEVLCEPLQIAPRRNKRRAEGLLREFRERSGDYNVGGSVKRKQLTAYREKALHIAYRLREDGESSPKTLKAITGVKETPSILQRNVYQWYVRVKPGRYRLTRSGEQALLDYADLLRHFIPEA